MRRHSRSTTTSLRYMKSRIVTSPLIVRSTASRKPRWRKPERCSADSRSVFDGIVPVLTDAPPRTTSRSISATLLPKYAACPAPFSPAGPEPMTMRSYMAALVADHRMELHPFDLAPSIEERKLDHRRGADEARVELAHERDGRGERAARSEDVVDHEHAIARRDRIIVDLDLVFAVFELVLVRAFGPRQLPRFADGDEAGAEDPRDAAAEDEAARLDAGDGGHALVLERLGQHQHARVEASRIAQQRRDVLEHDAGLGEIGNVSDQRAEPVCAHQNFTSKSPSLPVK